MCGFSLTVITSQLYNNGMNADLQQTAKLMRAQLENERLTVVLIPARFGSGKLRAVQNSNPIWYQEFCAAYEAQRTKPRQRKKFDTKIKRAHTLRALKEISRGEVKSRYAKRLLPYVEDYYHGILV